MDSENNGTGPRQFIDGFGGIYEFNGVVRIELLGLRRGAGGKADQGKMEPCGEIVIPLAAFLQAAGNLHAFARELAARQSGIEKPEIQPQAEVSKNN